jgi:predicted dithiol-disulfide oxidoreductase (DUF899 family)
VIITTRRDRAPLAHSNAVSLRTAARHDREEYEAARARLLVREKAHSREGDAIAAERRRLPMIEVPASVTVVGADGEVPFLDVFDGRRAAGRPGLRVAWLLRA